MNRILKATILLAFITLLSSSLISCKCHHKSGIITETGSKNDNSFTIGVIKKLPKFVGSCAWVIETADGKQYETRDVPTDFFVDGLKIKFKFTLIEGLMSKCQTGTIIRVTEIQKIQ